ncbi:MAG: Beta-barrel assembly-enhancing protease [Chloroflexi bacterium]|nr:Beta-barrel assembly-enhancing protease [Chloroflexota bacterium]
MEKAFYALELAPQYLPLHISIGDLLLKKDQVPNAIKKYLMVADTYGVQGKTERAISMLNKVVELSPMDIDVRQRLINLLVEYGHIDKAIEEHISLAEVFYSLAELDNARESYAKASRLVEKYHKEADWQARILHRLADIDIQRLEWESALEIFEQIYTILPGDEKACLNIISLRYRLGKDGQAEDELQRCVAYWENKSEHAKVIDVLEQLREEMPRKPALRRHLAMAYENQGRIEEAIAELDTLGELLLDSGQKTLAIEAISKIIDFRPPNLEQYQQLLDQMRG